MAKRIGKYFLILFAMYFLGHFLMSMSYSYGEVPATLLGTAACVMAIFIFIKACRLSGDGRGVFYGIFAGVLMWVFLGEFLEYKDIVGIVDPSFLPALIAYLLVVSLCAYKRYLPVGASFALGHFGGIWLNHFILINQVEGLSVSHPGLYEILLPATGICFLLIFLFLVYRLFRANSEVAQIGYTLFAFIFLWSVVESLQASHLVPDYTYYSYWSSNKHPVSAIKYPASWRVASEKKIESIKENYAWESEETRELAGYLLMRLRSSIVFKDFPDRLDTRIKEENTSAVGETVLCQVMEESISESARANYSNMIKRYVQEFKRGKLVATLYYGPETKEESLRLDSLKQKIASFKEKYAWEDSKTRELAGYLLERIRSPHALNDFSKKLDARMKEDNREKVDETMFCQVIKESMSTGLVPFYSGLVERYVQEFKKKNLINIEGEKA